MSSKKWSDEHKVIITMCLCKPKDNDIIDALSRGDSKNSEAKRLIRVGIAHDYYGKGDKN